MNTQSVDCRRVPNPLPEGFDVRPGDFSWSEEEDNRRVLYVCLPGDTHMTAIHVNRGAPGGHRCWGWDGNEEKPTLQPSIHWLEMWHGFMRNGRLESC